MSGIAGILHVDGQPLDAPLLTRMTDAMAHRGPDGAGQWTDGDVGFGHRLLHTTPESLHETQPFVSPDGKLVVVCDGRIDNREELTAALGSTLRTDTDVELILKAYERWGLDCPAHLLGDFAFAIWDSCRQRLFCARDPLGVKPFYYRWNGRRFLFASEIKVLLAVPGIPKRVNDTMIADYLLSDFRDPEATFFEGIRQLRPGHHLSLEDDQFRVNRYWEPDPSAMVSYPREEDYFDHFREVFREAVRCRLRSQFPVGLMLSGGADSTSVAAMTEGLRREQPGSPPLTMFTVLYEGFLHTEWENIQRLVERFGTDVSTIRPQARYGFLSYCELFEPFYAFESPFIVGIFAHPFVYEPARTRGCRVVLTGFGADELEQPSEIGMLKDLLRTGRVVRLGREIRRMASSYGTRTRDIAQYLREQAPPRVRWLIRTLRGRQVPPWIAPGFAKRQALARRLPCQIPARLPLMCQEESFRMLTTPAMVLHLNELDLLAASAGIEWRHPYLDRRLIEFFLSIPFPVKMNAGYEKPFTRRVLAGLLPRLSGTCSDGAEYIPSQEGPMSRTLEVQHLAQALGPLNGSLCRYVRGEELKRLMREFPSHEARRTQLWTAVHLKRWLEAFFPEGQDRSADGTEDSVVTTAHNGGVA